ncbi:glycosyltransferase [Halanaerobium congolense]|nr:glycosyltransferase [Halanaerobium congolense]
MSNKISIIVPVYNSEKYLRRCINSIISQTYSNLEIILINDGSEDKSGEICEEFSLLDNRVKVIHTENCGQASARNTGLKIATGDYIGFVDSDDWIDKDMYELLLKMIEKHDADIAECGFNVVYDDYIERLNKQSFIVSDKITSIRNFVKNSRLHSNIVIWNKLYSKKIISDLRFPIIPAYEDDYFTLRALYNSNKLVSTTNAKYNYYQTKAPSVIRGKFNKNRLSGLWVLNQNAKFLKNKVPQDIYEKAKQNYYGRLLYFYSMIFINNLDNCEDYKNKIEFEIKNNIKDILLSKNCLQLKLKAILFYLSEDLYLKIYKYYYKFLS